MCYFVDLELDLEVTFQGQKEKMLILSSGHLSFAHKTSWNVRKTLSTTAATPNTECWGVQRVGPLPLVLFSGEHFGTYILYHGAFLVETLTLRRRRDPLASASPLPWGHAPGCPLSISTLTLTSKVTLSGQGHENGKISSAFFSANLCPIETKLRTDADVDDPYRIMR